MTEGKPFSNEELEDLLNAIATHRSHLKELYAKPGMGSADWRARDKKFRDLQDKVIGMKS